MAMRGWPALDSKGTLCPLAENLVHFKVAGQVLVTAESDGLTPAKAILECK